MERKTLLVMSGSVLVAVVFALAVWSSLPIETAGIYTRAFEISCLEPVDYPGEHWWVEPVGEVEMQVRKMTAASHDPNGMRAFVRMRGHRTVRGRYGHLGRSDRLFRVEQVLEATILTDSEPAALPDTRQHTE